MKLQTKLKLLRFWLKYRLVIIAAAVVVVLLGGYFVFLRR
jgi:hypothetical protein